MASRGVKRAGAAMKCSRVLDWPTAPAARCATSRAARCVRLEIARALLHRPRLLLLDEATVGLDVKARFDILDHVRQLVREQGIGVLWATHLFDEVGPSDDLVVLHQGRMLAHGPVSRVTAEAGADDIHAAFMRLTGAADNGTSAP